MQVILRYVFRASNAWSEELSRYLFIWFTYLSACVCVYKNTHIRIDTLLKVWPKMLRPAIMVIGNLLFLAFCVITTYYGVIYTQSLMAGGRVSLGLQLQMWIVFAVIPVCNTAMALRLIQNMVKNFRSYKET
jgi:TRAP-type C4-dicarboxylate transport system permease small subunit